MPLYKRKPFESKPPPKDMKPDEEVFYFRLTNEIFKTYDDYFQRVILCNSMVWACSLTGKVSLTFQEALDSEKAARKQLKGFSKHLKRVILYLTTLTGRGRMMDVVDDVLVYARDRYFKGEEVLAVIGNLWCRSRVINVIEPTPAEIEAYRLDQIAKGEAENNDYLRDDSWGPAPDLFRYEVQELDLDDPEDANELHILEAIDVKREKTGMTKDKVRILLKIAMDFNELLRKCVLKVDVMKAFGLGEMKFTDIFIGKPPKFEITVSKAISPTSAAKAKPSKPSKKPESSSGSAKKPSGGKESKPRVKKEKIEKKEKILTPEEKKQLELEKKAKEREEKKAQKQMIADFKKLWFKPKEDLIVEDLKDLPAPDPVCCGIPNESFGDFMMALEFLSSYSSLLKVRDCFPTGIGFENLEKALTSRDIAGPLSDIVQILLRTLFRLQEGEKTEISPDRVADLELRVQDSDENVDVVDAIQEATAAATWSYLYQNCPIYKLNLDHLTLTEVLRLHLLSSGARQPPQSRGSLDETDDPGLQLRIDEPQILRTLQTGTVFDLSFNDKLKVLECLINQILSFTAVKEIMEESFEQFKQARISLRALQAAEKRKDAEDSFWRQKLKADKQIPDLKALKEAEEAEGKEEEDEKSSKKAKQPEKPAKPPLTDEQIEIQLTKRDREVAKRKQDFLWKEAELLDLISKHERKLGSHPFGRDRAYRKYWIFPTLPGLFVEHDDEFLGQCLPAPTPYVGDVDLTDVKFIEETLKTMKQKEQDGSDKENSVTIFPKKSSKKKVLANSVKKEGSADTTMRPAVYGVCNGDSDSCPVHSENHERVKWSFFSQQDQIEALIDGLTPRGIREKELRQSLIDEKDNLISLLKKCPAAKLNTKKQYTDSKALPDKRPSRSGGGSSKTVDAYLGYPWNTPIDTILELQLRDLILEMEEKIFLGGLGSLKIKDRKDWREAFESRGYKAGTDVLKWGVDNEMKISDKTDSTVKDIACGILQLQQAVEHKFLNRPLIEKEDDKKRRQKYAELELNWKNKLGQHSAVERWQKSLMACTGFSQLFVHFYTLESSVEWSRSVLNARCRVCRRKGDPDQMLLCDTCNRGHHAYCLKPPLENIPKGDWFCMSCRPAEPLPTPTKCRTRRDRLSDDDILQELESEEDEDDEDEDVGRGFNVQRSPKKMGNLQEDQDDPEVCATCNFGGEVICCDGCPLVYHLLCLDPPKTRVPRGTWFCPECQNPSKRKKNKSSSSRNRSRGGGGSSKSRNRIKPHSSDESEEETEDTEDNTEDDQQHTAPSLYREYTDSENDDSDTMQNSSGEEEEKEVVKVKFGTSTKRRSAAASSSTANTSSNRSYSNSTDHDGRGGKRRSASLAAAKISQVSKRLRGDYKENESSDNSNDSSSFNGHSSSRKRPSDDNDLTGDCPNKRTRLQRMNTNNKLENGELDNVLLDRLISDIMKQNDAWPFLKPVTRAEAPDYHGIVKYPMDLGTIKYKLNSMVYTCNEEFMSDLQLIFTNCFVYNERSNPIHEAGLSLREYCIKHSKKLGVSYPDSENEDEQDEDGDGETLSVH